MKSFNTTGVCLSSMHYMVDLSSCVDEIKSMVDKGKYFIMNRPRQYGKTTTLLALKKRLESEYSVLSLDFQGIGEAGFSTEEKFVQEFCRLVLILRCTISWNSALSACCYMRNDCKYPFQIFDRSSIIESKLFYPFQQMSWIFSLCVRKAKSHGCVLGNCLMSWPICMKLPTKESC